MVVLDTNTVSDYFRGDPRVVSGLLALRPGDVAIPSIVEYELHYGLLRLPAAAAEPRRQALSQFLRPVQILPFDSECAACAARIRATLEASGAPIGPHDTLIAATAVRHQATLVTRNVSEFSRVPGLQLVNWHAD
ncbi:Ribonuclease VapC2 [Tepidimonas thermarum]|uniref:Ribonuclease VapC n=1 Tax=Tepidimonas thermarum TaxID=335431 RepID=A0A554X8X7_9BURK|nr:type II toxin-antitoxin system VapC family toxin [Tepidimonas thermarum]TSE32284.1 Ribonuclease VapC2 [Tepidimonas thermarum]